MLVPMVATENEKPVVITLKSRPIFRAFCISVALHFIVFSVIELGHGLGWWKQSLVPAWLREAAQRQLLQNKNRVPKPNQDNKPEEEIPMTFIETDPSAPAEEPPKDTSYYSDQSRTAANLKSEAKAKVPKIDGKQQQVPRLADQARPQLKPQPRPEKSQEPAPPEPQPLQPETLKTESVAESKPQPPPPKEKSVAQTALKPEPELKPGDLEMGTPKPPQKAAPAFTADPLLNTAPVEPTPPAHRPRPRTLAMAREQSGMLAGEKMKQEGGVPRVSMHASPNIRGTAFGAYDAAFIAAVQSRWFGLLEQRAFVGNQTGKVVLDFRLHQDGRITDMHVQEAEVNETLSYICERAVQEPAPYQKFPSDLRRLLPNDYREVRFTFFYN
jgi:hypothetical protein